MSVVRHQSVIIVGLWCTLAALITGCPQPVNNTNLSMASAVDQNGNNTFSTATSVSTSNQSRLVIDGAIDAGDDLDIYRLPDLRAGDRLIVDVQRQSGNLDATVTIYGPDQNLQAFNDDRVLDGSNLNPLLDIDLLGLDGDFYVAVSNFPGSQSLGDYEILIDIERGNGAPPTRPAVVYLNWAGGTVESEVFPNITLGAFSAEDVGLADSQTEVLKDLVQQRVVESYAKFNLTVLNSDDHALPQVPHSTVFYGGNNFQAFALAEKIDVMNADESDIAMVFSSTFELAFQGRVSLSQMGTAIGNTTAHEIGHLLGLVHTKDCASLMDGTCSNNALLTAQEFREAPLDENTFPLGFQNADELLGWLLGLR
jgi:hypothetical protein